MNDNWISVKKELPMIGNLVLMHCVKPLMKEVAPFTEVGFLGEGREWLYSKSCEGRFRVVMSDITHWQPLPTPPQPEKER